MNVVCCGIREIVIFFRRFLRWTRGVKAADHRSPRTARPVLVGFWFDCLTVLGADGNRALHWILGGWNTIRLVSKSG